MERAEDRDAFCFQLACQATDTVRGDKQGIEYLADLS